MRFFLAAAISIAATSIAFAQTQRADRAALKSAYQELASSFCGNDVDATIEMRALASDLVSLANELDTRARAALSAGSESNWRYLNIKSTEAKTFASRVEIAISQHRTQVANYAALCRVLSAP